MPSGEWLIVALKPTTFPSDSTIVPKIPVRPDQSPTAGDPPLRLVRGTDARTEPEAVPRGTIEPQRLRAVLRRLERGVYDGPEVRDRIAARVTADLP